MRFIPGAIVMLSLVSPVLLAQQARPAIDSNTTQAETYDSADVDDNGNLRITTSDGRVIRVPKEGQQSTFSRPTVSPDGTAVGAAAEYPNCCTSYDIPLEVVVYSKGKVHRFKGVGLPIFLWHFADGGTRIAYGQEPVHFGCQIHYELRNIDSELLIDSTDVPQPCGQQPVLPIITIPKWVQALNAARR